MDYIDLMKGIGIILVVAGHAASPFSDWIYSFHMGLFFWISGYTLAIKELPGFPDFLKKKIKTILVPYVGYGLVAILFQMRERAHYNTSIQLPEYLLGLAKGGSGLDTVGNIPLWFLQLLFIAIIFFYAEVRFFPTYCIAIVGLLISLGTLRYQEIFISGSIFEINVLPCALVYMTIGYLSYKFLDEKKVKTSWGIVLLSIGWYLQLCYGGSQIRHIFTYWYYVYSVLQIIGIYFICKNVKHISFINKFGENSIYILGMHGVLVAYATLLMDYIFERIAFDSEIVKHLGITLALLIWSYAIGQVWISINKGIKSKLLEQLKQTLFAKKE